MDTRQILEPRILEAAVRLFSRQGYYGASTREIAKLADVHETSMFRYFPRKEELFLAALEYRLKRLRMHKELHAGLADGARPEVVIPLIFELLVRIMAFEPELVRLLSIGLLELPSGTERVCRKHVGPVLAAIHEYVANSVKRGKLRDLDPSHVTAAFVTTAFMHQGICELLTGKGLPYRSTDEAVSAYSSFWLDALVSAQAVPWSPGA
jgi:AcrR family transcriptional regulator